MTTTAVSEHGSIATQGRLMRVKEVADRLAMARSTVYELMDSGQLAYIKIGKSRRVSPEEVERLIERSTVGA